MSEGSAGASITSHAPPEATPLKTASEADSHGEVNGSSSEPQAYIQTTGNNAADGTNPYAESIDSPDIASDDDPESPVPDTARAAGGTPDSEAVAHPERQAPSSLRSADVHVECSNTEGARGPAARTGLSGSALTFGPSARLRPEPPRLADQPVDVGDHVADTSLDWLNVKWASIRAVSARGHMHRHLGEMRQDAFALGTSEGFLALAVADGLGSATASHVGSAIAARQSVQWQGLAQLSADHGGQSGTIGVEEIAEQVAEAARARGVSETDVCTTLILALVDPSPPNDGGEAAYDVLLLQVGDSSAWRIANGVWSELGRSDDSGPPGSLISTAVDPLPLHREARIWRERFRPGETLALVSDGIGNILSANDEFATALAGLWTDAAPTPAQLLELVDATVKSFDDDRTFVGLQFSEPKS
jgi:serine/threonine protein phosphatase PrpC